MTAPSWRMMLGGLVGLAFAGGCGEDYPTVSYEPPSQPGATVITVPELTPTADSEPAAQFSIEKQSRVGEPLAFEGTIDTSNPERTVKLVLVEIVTRIGGKKVVMNTSLGAPSTDGKSFRIELKAPTKPGRFDVLVSLIDNPDRPPPVTARSTLVVR